MSEALKKSAKGEVIGFRTDAQRENDQQFHRIAQDIVAGSGENWSMHSLAVMKRNALARVLYLHELYQQILPVAGVICEFGVHWGGSLATLLNLRGMLEPYNSSRLIYGFDTFEGFAGVSAADGAGAKTGDYATRENYDQTLDAILRYHESISPFPERKKYELIKGDAGETVAAWLKQNPQTVIAMAMFDMDIYKPTKAVLEQIKPRMPKGALLVFDELNCPFFPGETAAVEEVLGIRNLRLRRHPLQPYCAWAVVE